MKAIVIGGVAAGMSAASKLRRVKPDAQIVVYERGGFLSYGACGLPYYVGGFNDDPAKLIARTQAVYKEMRIETHLFHEVTRIDPERKTVTVRNLDTGAVFEDAYDVLMVATGCNSVNPKIPGADSPAVFYLKTMEDGLLLHEILRLRDVTRVAVVGVHPGEKVGSAALRYQGYLEALEEAGVEFDDRLVVESGMWHRSDGVRAMNALLDSGVEVDGVVALNDMLASGVMHAIQMHGLHIPDDISVVGFDNSDDSQYLSPALTSIAPGLEAVARLSVKVLKERIDGRDPNADRPGEKVFRKVTSSLVVRQSTKLPADSLVL